jgi:FlaG/FlaF family flagellin (archaellin)
MRRNKEKKDDAVSPVVGVMLMLVVTIIIAAVVSAFAGGVTSSQAKTPQASIEVSTGYISGNFDIKFEHKGGDPILTKECQFITYLTLQNGTVVRHIQTPTSSLARSDTPTLSDQYTYSRGPHLTDPQKYAYPCNPANDVTLSNGWTVYGYTNTSAFPEGANYAWFGQAVWLPGDIARTYNNGYTANFVGLVSNPMSPTSAEIALLKECVERNCKLEIKMLHVPSGKYIMDRTIMLQG